MLVVTDGKNLVSHGYKPTVSSGWLTIFLKTTITDEVARLIPRGDNTMERRVLFNAVEKGQVEVVEVLLKQTTHRVARTKALSSVVESDLSNTAMERVK
jgi:hypothetical protein